MSSVWQQILAVDARYNAHRAPNDPTFRALYIRRRSQLLREFAKRSTDAAFQKDCLLKRSLLLANRYSYVPSEGSNRSRSLSVRSGSQLTLEGDIEPNKRTSLFPTQSSPRKVEQNETYLFEKATCSFPHHTNSITRLRFAHDDKRRFAASSMDCTISVCRIPENEPTAQPEVIALLKGHTQGVVDVVWSVSNDLLLSCSLDSTLRLWNPVTGECIRILEDTCSILCCIFQPINNNQVVTGNMKGLVQVVNISTGKYVKTGICRATGSVVCMCCDNTGRLLWVGDDKGTLLSFLVDPTLGKLVKGNRIIVANQCPVTSICFRPAVVQPDGHNEPLILLNVATNFLYIFNVINSSGNLKPKRRISLQHRRLTIHSSFCPLVSFRQGAFAVSGSEDGMVHLYNVDSNDRSLDMRLKGHHTAVIDVSFNHDESFLISGDSKGKIIVWKRTEKDQPMKMCD